MAWTQTTHGFGDVQSTVTGAASFIFDDNTGVRFRIVDIGSELVAQWDNSGVWTDLLRFSDPTGATPDATLSSRTLKIIIGTLSASQQIVDISGTWSSGGTTFTALKLNITDTASAAASILLDLQVASVSKFKVLKNGQIVSSLATGTAPLSIASTTKVANLNVDLLDGADTTSVGAASAIPILDGAGRLRLGADPSNVLDAATKQYVDNQDLTLMDILDRDVILADVTSSATEDTLYTFTVPANTLSTNKALRLTLLGDILKNAANTLTLKVYYASTVIFTSGAITFTASASRRDQKLVVELVAANATNAQVATTKWDVTAPGTQDGTGLAVAGTTEGADFIDRMGFHNTVAVDSTSGQILKVTAQWSGSSASLSCRAHTVQLEVLR